MKKKKTQQKKFNKFQSLFDIKYLGYDFIKLTGCIPALLFFRVKYFYKNKETKKELRKTPCIIVANHHSFLDPFLMLTVYYNKRVSIIATKELYEGKLKNFLFTVFFRSIKIDKDNVSLKTFKDVKNVILRGHSVGIFPEGGIHNNQEGIEGFKSGAIMMANMANAPIYPVYFKKRTHWWQSTKVIFGEKFDVSSYINGKATSAALNEVAKELFIKEKELEEISKTL